MVADSQILAPAIETAVLVVLAVGILTALFLEIWRRAADTGCGFGPVEAFGAALSFGALAYASGYLAGISRVAVLGQLLPASLGLIGGVAVFMFGKDDGNRTAVGVAITSFSACLFIGFLNGGEDRVQRDLIVTQRARLELAEERSLREQEIFNVELQALRADREFRINTIRAALNLAPIDFLSLVFDQDD